MRHVPPAIGADPMSKFSSFVMGMVVGAMVLHAVTNFHVVRARDGFHFVAKQPPRMAEVYVDIRAFGMTDWASHPQLVTALTQADKQLLVGDSAGGAVQEGLNSILQDWSTPAR